MHEPLSPRPDTPPSSPDLPASSIQITPKQLQQMLDILALTTKTAAGSPNESPTIEVAQKPKLEQPAIKVSKLEFKTVNEV